MYTLTKISLLAMAVCFVATFAQAGQEDSGGIEERLLECDQISDSAAKLACIDVVIKGIKQDGEADARAPSVPVDDPSTPNIATGATATATDVAVEAIATPDEVLPTQAKTSAGADKVQSTEAVEIASDASSRTDSTAEFGLEDQIVAEQKESLKVVEEEVNEVLATIVDSWETVDRRFEVLLDNGQVWRETELTRTTRLPKAGSAVRITRASLGSYRMKIGNNNRLAAVRRTR